MYTMNEDYYIGIQMLDEQHQELFKQMDNAKTLLKDENILYKYDELIKIIKGLEHYTRNHFKEEVAFMESIDYPRLQLHLAAHQSFVDKLNTFEIDVEQISLGTQDKMLMELVDFLIQWLQVHILDCDKKIARFLNGEKITVDMD